MKSIFFGLFVLSAFFNCSNKKIAKDNSTGDIIPACVNEKIIEWGKPDTEAPLLQVDEYNYKGKTVYLFTADCCDFYNIAYTDSCRQICAPSGGITGRGDGQCPDFTKEAKLVKLVWKKEQ